MTKRKRLTVFCFLLLAITRMFALTVPQLTGPVNDLAGIISAEQKKEIEVFLFDIEKKADVQIVVLTIPSLEEENLEDYSLRVASNWQLGSREKDSGVLLLVAANDRKMRIEVGYGLEANLTDAHAGRIIRNVIAPEFKRGDFGTGILLGVKSIAGYALQDEELLTQQTNENEWEGTVEILIYLMGLFILMLPWFIFFRVIPCFFWILYRIITKRGLSRAEIITNLFTSSSAFKFSNSSRSGSRSSGYSGRGGSFGGGGASGSW